MLNLSILELLLRAIPDATLFIMGIHIFSKSPIDKVKIIKSIIYMSVVIYLIRFLPISYGIHSLLGVVANTMIVTTFHKIELVKTLKAVFLTMLVQYVSELINVAWIQLGLGKDLDIIFSNPTTKILYGLPSLFISGSLLYFFYIRSNRRKEVTNEGQ